MLFYRLIRNDFHVFRLDVMIAAFVFHIFTLFVFFFLLIQSVLTFCLSFDATSQGYPLEYAKNVKRVHYQHTRAEQDHLNKASSLERVKLSICPVKDLLPDEDARIFIKVCFLLFMFLLCVTFSTFNRNLSVVLHNR